MTDLLKPQHKLLSIQKAADYLGVSIETLRRWNTRELLVPTRTKGGQRRYTMEQLHGFKKKKRKISHNHSGNRIVNVSETIDNPLQILFHSIVGDESTVVYGNTTGAGHLNTRENQISTLNMSENVQVYNNDFLNIKNYEYPEAGADEISGDEFLEHHERNDISKLIAINALRSSFSTRLRFISVISLLMLLVVVSAGITLDFGHVGSLLMQSGKEQVLGAAK